MTQASLDRTSVPTTQSKRRDTARLATESSKSASSEDEKCMPEDRRGTIKTVSDSEGEDAQPYLGDQSLRLGKPHTHTIGILKLRAQDDTDPTDWWFASTAIPLIAATFAPMANLLSIAALVVYWRNKVTTADDPSNIYSMSVGYPDPKWCLALNGASLACGFVGNLFLLFNFTKRMRYIIALPLTIFFFFLACTILTAIVICIEKYDPPQEGDVYSQGYWHAVIAACLYMVNGVILMVNMWGYFLGHYPQNFTLNDEHRNLILQTMLFFIWLGGGAGVFARTENWTYPDALYFCDVTILTIGFGDLYAQDDLARGLVFPYSVGGTIILGLMVSSIHKFARELSKEKVIRKHVETRRVNTLSRAVTIEDLDDNRLTRLATGKKLSISLPLPQDSDRIQRNLNELARTEGLKRRTINFQDANKQDYLGDEAEPAADPAADPEAELATSYFFGSRSQGGGLIHKSLRTLAMPIVRPVTMTRKIMTRNQKQILMLQERDRFNAMRSVQIEASNFKRYYALVVSIICFGLLWCLGAVVFFFAEADTQGLNFFECLYFCYVSLLTIGYGDLSPRSSAGKAFFVVWSLIAVPTMTILVSDLGDTVIGGFKRGVLKNDLGLTSQKTNSPSSWRSYLAHLFSTSGKELTGVDDTASKKASQLEAATRRSSGIRMSEPKEAILANQKTIEELANEDVSEAEMMRRLAYAIRQTADDIKQHPDKRYTYEEWVQFTRLIKFSKFDKAKLRSGEAGAMTQLEYDEAEDGIVEWDWLDANSPMTSDQTESEWILDRLCESLLRVFKKSDLVLGGLGSGIILHQPGILSPEIAFPATLDVAEPDPAPDELPESPRSQPLRRLSDAVLRSPDVVSKVTRFFQGDDVEDDTPQWSRRAKAKKAGVIEESEVDANQNVRRGSWTAPAHRRHGPFAR